MKESGSQSKSPSQLIDARIEELGDWRGEMLSRLRSLVKEADPEVVEEWKWMGTPVWSHDGIVCTGRDVQEGREADLRPGGGSLRTHRASSIPAWKGTHAGAPSTSTRGRRSTRRRSRLLVSRTAGGPESSPRRRQARRPSQVRVRPSRSRCEKARRSPSSSRAATRRSRRRTATPRCRRTSPRCRAGSATSGSASTRSSCGTCPTCARP